MNRQELFEKSVRENISQFRSMSLISINGGTVKFKWHAKKVTHTLFIEFNINPGELGYAVGWMPMYAYGRSPIMFANFVCDDLKKLDDANAKEKLL